MPNKFRAVARRSYLELGVPKVGREVVGLYATRKEATLSVGSHTVTAAYNGYFLARFQTVSVP